MTCWEVMTVQYLTIAQAAEMLGVHANTVRRMLPQLGAVDLTRGRGGKRLIRIPEAALQRYLRGCLIPPPMRGRRKT